jgi:hypothetical protein
MVVQSLMAEHGLSQRRAWDCQYFSVRRLGELILDLCLMSSGPC